MKEKEKYKIVIINKPTKLQSEVKIRELCEYLSKVWFFPINSDGQKVG